MDRNKKKVTLKMILKSYYNDLKNWFEPTPEKLQKLKLIADIQEQKARIKKYKTNSKGFSRFESPDYTHLFNNKGRK